MTADECKIVKYTRSDTKSFRNFPYAVRHSVAPIHSKHTTSIEEPFISKRVAHFLCLYDIVMFV